MKPVPVVALLWHEHHSLSPEHDAYFDVAELAEAACNADMTMLTIGVLVHETPTHYMVSATYCPDDNTCGEVMAILKSAVTHKASVPFP